MSENETQLVTLLVPKSLLKRFDAAFVDNKPTTRADVIRNMMEEKLLQVEPDFKPDKTDPCYIANRRNELRIERNSLIKEQERLLQRLDSKKVNGSSLSKLDIISQLFYTLGYHDETGDLPALLKKLQVYEINGNDRFNISDLEEGIEMIECGVRKDEIDKELMELRKKYIVYIKSKKKPKTV